MMRGEQFATQRLGVEAILLELGSVPDWLETFLDETWRKNVIRAHHSAGRRDQIRETFLSVPEYFSDGSSQVFPMLFFVVSVDFFQPLHR